jgi:hypothetical protein
MGFSWMNLIRPQSEVSFSRTESETINLETLGDSIGRRRPLFFGSVDRNLKLD